MKKLTIALLTILSSGAAYALPVGNPAEPGMMREGFFWEGHYADPRDPCATWFNTLSLRLGFYGDYVFDRSMEVEEDHHDADLDTTEIFTSAGILALNAWDRLDLFVTLGASKLYIDANGKAFALGSGRFEIETNTDFSWSVGIRGIIWQCGCTLIGGEAQYFYTKPDVIRLTQNDTTSVYPKDYNALYHEWQVGFAISHQIHNFTPYLGLKLSRGFFKLKDRDVPGFTPHSATLFSLETKKDWGFALGASYVVCKVASLNVEGRFGDEKAVYVTGQVRL